MVMAIAPGLSDFYLVNSLPQLDDFLVSHPSCFEPNASLVFAIARFSLSCDVSQI
jgi:hypothetical protein